MTWRARGSIPHAIESTALLVELLLKSESDAQRNASQRSDSERRLSLATAIMRFVNGVVDEEQRSQYANAVGALGRKLGIAPILVEIRHSVAHERLPPLPALQHAAKLALEWLDEHYWKLQSVQKPNYSDELSQLIAEWPSDAEDYFPRLFKYPFEEGLVGALVSTLLGAEEAMHSHWFGFLDEACAVAPSLLQSLLDALQRESTTGDSATRTLALEWLTRLLDSQPMFSCNVQNTQSRPRPSTLDEFESFTSSLAPSTPWSRVPLFRPCAIGTLQRNSLFFFVFQR